MWSICACRNGSDAYVTIARFVQTRAETSCQLKLQTKFAFIDFKGLRFVVAHGLRSHSRKVLGRLVTEVYSLFLSTDEE